MSLDGISTFTRLESKVRSYCRSFPTIFTQARGDILTDQQGRHYIDFFAGAGALNYGHNNLKFKKDLLEYIQADRIVHSLDLFTVAKQAFLERFEEVILKPRKLNYKIMFPGPTGTNAVEAALKLARKASGRKTIASFDKGFHGVTLGSLATTANQFYRQAAGVPLNHSISLPFNTRQGRATDDIKRLQQILDDFKRQGEKPAAFILETVQAEGGINVASTPWLKSVFELLREEGILSIVDDIQVGCGRTGPFFSFERAGLKPDIICLSKSLSGYGTPMSVVLLHPDLDCWEPGEHNGTFRGHNLAFVTATAALEYWKTDVLSHEVADKATIVSDRLKQIVAKYTDLRGEHRGLGLIQGISCGEPSLAKKIGKEAFERGLIIECSGSKDEVLKLLPPLTIDSEVLRKGLNILEESVASVLSIPKLNRS